jgi:hypothetical protein
MKLVEETKSIQEVLDLLSLEQWNKKNNPTQDISNYLYHPIKHVRYATAFNILKLLNGNFSFRNNDLESYRTEAERQIMLWHKESNFYAVSEEMESPAIFWHDLIKLLPLSKEYLIDTLRLIDRIYSHWPVHLVARSAVDKLRELLKINYSVTIQTKNFSSSNEMQNSKALEKIPEDLLKIFLKYYFSLPPELQDSNMIANQSLALLQDKRSKKKPIAQTSKSCNDLFVVNRHLLNILSLETISRYDSGNYIWQD